MPSKTNKKHHVASEVLIEIFLQKVNVKFKKYYCSQRVLDVTLGPFTTHLWSNGQQKVNKNERTNIRCTDNNNKNLHPQLSKIK